MVQVEPLIEIHNMVGTIASFSQQNKLDKRVDRFCEFISSTKAVRDIWTSKLLTATSLQAVGTQLLSCEEIQDHKNHMQQILEEFAQLERMQRERKVIQHD
jgi:hypothetical protein